MSKNNQTNENKTKQNKIIQKLRKQKQNKYPEKRNKTHILSFTVGVSLDEKHFSRSKGINNVILHSVDSLLRQQSAQLNELKSSLQEMSCRNIPADIY